MSSGLSKHSDEELAEHRQGLDRRMDQIERRQDGQKGQEFR